MWQSLNWEELFIEDNKKWPGAWILSKACPESNLPVTLNGIFTSTNITQWRINSTITQNVWRSAKPFILHPSVFWFVQRWSVIVYIEKNKWPPSGYAQRYKPKFLYSKPTKTKPNYPSIWKMLYIYWMRLSCENIFAYIYIEVLDSCYSGCLEEDSI